MWLFRNNDLISFKQTGSKVLESKGHWLKQLSVDRKYHGSVRLHHFHVSKFACGGDYLPVTEYLSSDITEKQQGMTTLRGTV